jgi:hypothetical protein
MALLLAEQARVAAEQPDEFWVWQEHVAALELFRAVATQFRYSATGLPTGLDYASVRASPFFVALPVDQRESTFADVCVMERAWISAVIRAEAERRQEREHFEALGHG